MSFLRFLMLLALAVWVGGIIFFAMVLAPTVFSLLPVKFAGEVVNATLPRLHWMGLVSGVVFLAGSLLYNQQKHGDWSRFRTAPVFVVVMLALTAYSQFSIIPGMRELRSTVNSPGSSPEFNRLHAWSTRLEGGVLLLGIGVVALTARRN